jgi:hypothetical protein
LTRSGHRRPAPIPSLASRSAIAIGFPSLVITPHIRLQGNNCLNGRICHSADLRLAAGLIGTVSHSGNTHYPLAQAKRENDLGHGRGDGYDPLRGRRTAERLHVPPKEEEQAEHHSLYIAKRL